MNHYRMFGELIDKHPIILQNTKKMLTYSENKNNSSTKYKLYEIYKIPI